MTRTICLALCLLTSPALVCAADAEKDALNAPRVNGSLIVTCTPDAKSAAARAQAFRDTLDIGRDRVKSATLTAEGFPVALAIPKLVNGVTTLNVTFKKTGATATYFVRAKPDGTTSGAFTRTEGGKTLRYTIGATSAREAGETTSPIAADDDRAGLDPDVLRVNGGFVRLMSVHTAMADAGVNADKAKVTEVLKAAGTDQNAMRAALLKGTLKPEQYVKQAEARLAEANKSLAAVLGPEKAAKVEQAYGQPFASGYVYLNQMRAAAAEAAPPPDVAKRVDRAVYDALIELTKLAKQKDALTHAAVDTLKDKTVVIVLVLLGEAKTDRFRQTLQGMTAYEPSDGAAAAKEP